MGNRAVITTPAKQIGIYLHWNGGRDSVEGFLSYCKKMGFRDPAEDNYGIARLVQVIANFFGPDGLSIGVDVLENLDTMSDNGVYIISNWEIVGRENFEYEEQSGHNRDEFLSYLNSCQPSSSRERFDDRQIGFRGLDAKSI